nr:carboxypeptidase B [Bombyx mori]
MSIKFFNPGQKPKSTYLLLGNVSLADTIVGFSLIFGMSMENTISSNVLCIFQIGMLACPVMVSLFSVGLIAVDRYIYILHGLYYGRWFNTKRVRIGILCTWIISLTLGFLPATGWKNEELLYTRCYYVALFPGILVLLNSVLSIIPIIVVAVLYSIILFRALKNVKNLKAAKNDEKPKLETPKLRMYRGTVNENKVKTQFCRSSTSVSDISVHRSSSFHLSRTNQTPKSRIKISTKSKSIDDLTSDNANILHDYRDSKNNDGRTHESGHESNHQLYRVSGPATEFEYLEAYLDLLSTKSAARSTSGQLEALVRLSPEEKQKWLPLFDKKNMAYTKVVDNLADVLRDEEAQINRARHNSKRSGRAISFNAYYRHDEMNEYLESLAALYPGLVTVINAGLSYEGRQIKYVKISTTRFENLRKPVILIDAAVHAREWVTPPVALYIIHQLVEAVVDRRLTEGIDWIIIPMANPDGYEYTIDEDRMWRKTRSRSHPEADTCPGVDGNRNFDHHWGTREASKDPCSIIFEGPTAFSEPETRIIRDVALQNVDRAALYISLHSYGNMFLYAWGNNGSLPNNALALHLAGVRMAEAIDRLALDKADRYIVGNAAQVLYFTSGTSRDWTRAIGIPLTYTMELPGYEYDFIVPPEYVEQIVTETWAGIAAGAHFVLSIW